MQTKTREHFGDDLLAGECAATALDELAGGIGLIGPIDIERQLPHFIEVHHRDAGRLEESGGLVGAGDHGLRGCPDRRASSSMN